MPRQAVRLPRNKGGRHNHGKGFPSKKPKKSKVISKWKNADFPVEIEIMLELMRKELSKGKSLKRFLEQAISKYGDTEDPPTDASLEPGNIALFFLELLSLDDMSAVAICLLDKYLEKKYGYPISGHLAEKLARPIQGFTKEQVKNAYLKN